MRHLIRGSCVSLALISLLSATLWFLSTNHDTTIRWVATSQGDEVGMFSVRDGMVRVGVRSGTPWPERKALTGTEYVTPFVQMFR